MLFYKRFISECIKKHSKDLERGAYFVMKAQDLEKKGYLEKAVKCYKRAKQEYKNAEMFAGFLGDKQYQWEAKTLIKMVDEQMEKCIVRDFYRGGISH